MSYARNDVYKEEEYKHSNEVVEVTYIELKQPVLSLYTLHIYTSNVYTCLMNVHKGIQNEDSLHDLQVFCVVADTG